MIKLNETFGFLAIQSENMDQTTDLLSNIKEFCSSLPHVYIQQVNLPGFCLIYWSRNPYPREIDNSDDKYEPANSKHTFLIGNLHEPAPQDSNNNNAWSGLNGRYAWLQWQQHSKILTATSDFLGIRPLYYLHADKALLISNEIFPLVESGYTRNKINPTGYVQMLEKGYCLGSNTLHNDIKWLPPGSSLVSSNRSIKVTNKTYLMRGHSQCKENSYDAMADQLYELLLASTTKRTNNKAHSILLSGGLDSRVVGGLLQKLDLISDTFTWHQGTGGDLVAAKEIAKALGVHPKFITIPHDHLQKHHEELIKLDGGATNAHITYLLAALHSFNGTLPPLAIGYAGDPLTGAHIPYRTHLGSLHPSIEESVEHFDSALGRFFKDDELLSILRKPEWKDAIGSSREEIKKTMLAAQTNSHFNRWTAALLWNRNLRCTTFLPRLCDNFTPTFSPFEDKTVYEYCLSLPFDALNNQLVYRKMVGRHFKKLAKIPRSNGEQVCSEIELSARYRYTALAAKLAPKPLRQRISRWGGGGYAIDPNADLRIGSTQYLKQILKQDDRWGEFLDPKKVSSLINNHLDSKTKQGLQIQALVTVLESLSTRK